MLTFEYALVTADGQYYTGRAGEGWIGAKHEAFTYTMQGAARKIKLPGFTCFTVERIV